MAKFLLIDSHDPFASDDGGHFYDLAASLARAANQVTLVLTQAGVLPARAGEHTFWFAALARHGVEVLADERSLRERGIAGARLSPGVKPISADATADRLAEGRRTLRH
jgi:intracellular sulfur oxidation DsrE/DsrF family protein